MKQTFRRLLSAMVACSMVLAIFMVNPSTVKAAELDYSCVFNAAYYSAANPDLKAVYGDDAAKLLEHFKNHGMSEGRQGSEEFNVSAYMNRYADLKAAYGNDLKKYYIHYITSGKAEGRNARVAEANAPKKASAELPADAVQYEKGYFLPSTAKKAFPVIASERSKNGKANVEWSESLSANARNRAREISKVFSDNRPDGTKAELAYDSSFRPIKELQLRFYGVVTTEEVVKYLTNNSRANDFIIRDNVDKCGITIYTENDMSYVIVVFTYTGK